MYIETLFDDFLNYLRTARGRSDATLKEYYYDLRMVFRFLVQRKEGLQGDLEEVPLDAIDDDFLKSINKRDIYAYSSYLMRERGNGKRTVVRKLSSVRTFFRYLHETLELLESNPLETVELPKIEKRLPVYLTLEESVHLLQTVKESKQQEIYRLRDYAITLLFLNVGIRLSELANIQVADLNHGQTLRIFGKGAKERMVYLNDTVLEALNTYLKERKRLGLDNDTLFLSMRKTPMSTRSIQHMMEKHLKNAGFDTRKYTVHKLRHTAATLMYQYGDEDIRALQEILGHESMTTTQIYTHVSAEDVRHMMNKNPLGRSEDLNEMLSQRGEKSED
ncbi:MAG: tyrosine recombinase XerC [Tissierellia bacterium]|nr:tyrosine recombinase XerC [Tissierellia bacterium]